MTGRRISSRRVSLVAGAILACIAVLAGSMVFWVMQHHAERLLRDSLQLALQGRVEVIDAEFRAAASLMASIPEHALLVDRVSRLDADASDQNALRDLRVYFLLTMRFMGVSAIEISGRDGRRLADIGTFAEAPEMSVPLTLPGNPDLLWKDGFVLNAGSDIEQQGKRIGSIHIQMRLPEVDQTFRPAGSLGRTGDQMMCASSGDRMLCFPMTLTPHPTSFSKRSASGVPLPMTYALEGKSGSIIAHDYRRQEVVAAFRPVGSTGLGMVLKKDSAELYATIRDQIYYLLPNFAGILLVAFLLLRWQLTPLATGLVRSEREAHDALARLKDSERHMAAVVENVDEGIITLSPAGVIKVFNPAAERIFGRTSAEVVGQSLSMLVPGALNGNPGSADWAPLLESLAGRAEQSGQEVSALRSDGETFPIEFTLSEYRLDGGRQLIVIVRDITARKQAEAGQARLAAIVDSSEDAIFSKDLNGIISTWNRGAEKLFGYAAAEIIGQTVTRLFPPGKLDEELAILAQIKTGETANHYETVYIARGGRHIDVSTTISPVYGSTGQIVAASKIVRDITERKQAEEQLAKANAGLQRSNRELQEFASVASHDLQEPLRKIQAFGDRLKAQAGPVLDAMARDYLERMENAAGRMQLLINDLLTYAQVTSKAQPFASVDLNTVTREVLADLEIRLEETGGRVEVGELPVIEADATQMRQLLQNLIANALKFHRPGQPPVVKIFCESGAGAVTRLHVADNGIGFDEQYLDRIFTLFQRLHGRHEYAGTGVGLTVCQKIATRHGGSITARSQPGQGATFIVTLPNQPTKVAQTP